MHLTKDKNFLSHLQIFESFLTVLNATWLLQFTEIMIWTLILPKFFIYDYPTKRNKKLKLEINKSLEEKSLFATRTNNRFMRRNCSHLQSKCFPLGHLIDSLDQFKNRRYFNFNILQRLKNKLYKTCTC